MSYEQPNAKQIARAIKDLRTKLDMSQQAFAGHIDASINSIAKYETGQMKPGHDRLARCLKLAVDVGLSEAVDVFTRALMVDCRIVLSTVLQKFTYHIPQIKLDLEEFRSEGTSNLTPVQASRLKSIEGHHLQQLLSELAVLSYTVSGDAPADAAGDDLS